MTNFDGRISPSRLKRSLLEAVTAELLEKMDPMQRYRHLQARAHAAANAEENRRKRWQEILRNNPPAQFKRLPSDDTEGGEA